MSWVSLHTHSQFSILDSTASIQGLVDKAKSYQMSALALTDQGSLFGVVDFYKACIKANIKPIIGCELWIAPYSRFDKKKTPGMPAAFPLIFLAKSNEGFKNLCKLSSLGYLEGFYYYPRIDKEILQKYHKGLICLSGSLNSPFGFLLSHDKLDQLQEEINWYANLFEQDFYLELQSHSITDEEIQQQGIDRETWLLQKFRDFEKREKKARQIFTQIAQEKDLFLVATNDIHYLEKDDWKGHEILLNIQSGEPCEIWERDSFGNPKNKVLNPKRTTYPNHEYYFKSSEQMQSAFSDVKQACANTLKIAELCHCELDFKTKHYPIFVPPSLVGKSFNKKQREQETGDYLYSLCKKNIPDRYRNIHLEKVKEKYPNQDPLEIVQKRLDYEFQLLKSKGMCDYLLIVYDFIHWAKKQNIPVGPGRGSAAGSIIAYLIGITDIEPLRFHLFFERFINPERISYPDIDVDICMERRSEVIEYMIQKYGKDRVAQIITFGTMKAKMAIKDVGRVLSVALSKVNAIAKLVPEDPQMTLEKALHMDLDLKTYQKEDAEAKEILEIGRKIEGSIRNTSIHAAGLIVSEDSIMDHVPVCIAKDADIIVTQYSMKPVEVAGMLKIDFLGLKTLTSIQKAVELIKKTTNREIDWTNLPLDDPKTYRLLNQGKTLGVFQLESAGMQELAKQLHIDCFEEIIAVGALYRPGPMDMIPSFINRKKGIEAIEFDHPLMKEILSETYGIMVYQEQVMQIANTLAGYSLGEGDVLRKAMGKKDRAEMKRQRKKFLNGALEKGVSEEVAETIFNKIEKFASYGFNKSHATAYAYLSYVTAYLKANFEKQWMAALMTCDLDDLSKVTKFIRECQVLKIAIMPPNVNEASLEFVPTKEGISFAMSAIKGIGSAVVNEMIVERDKRGPFKSLEDFIKRIDSAKIGKKTIELLVDAGAFDFTGWTRDELRLHLEMVYDKNVKMQKEKAKGVMNFFSLLGEDHENPSPPSVTSLTPKEKIYLKEKELLGFYLTGHPLNRYESLLKRLGCIPLREPEKLPPIFCTAFIIEKVHVKITNKTQKKFAILTISSEMERFELPIWPDMYAEKQHLLVENHLFYAILQADKSNDVIRLQCKYLEELSQIDETFIVSSEKLFQEIQAQTKQKIRKKKMEKPEDKDSLSIGVDINQLSLSKILNLKKVMRDSPGKTPIAISFLSNGKKVGLLEIDSSWGVDLKGAFYQNIKNLSFVSDLQVDKKLTE